MGADEVLFPGNLLKLRILRCRNRRHLKHANAFRIRNAYGTRNRDARRGEHVAGLKYTFRLARRPHDHARQKLR